jgi:hypothetical protein
LRRNRRRRIAKTICGLGYRGWNRADLEPATITPRSRAHSVAEPYTHEAGLAYLESIAHGCDHFALAEEVG